ncbi:MULTISPECIES: GlsB/YeaQ/YmgE family stress response membrane protein [Eisenbergiella]|nr:MULTISPECIES: GlsB/YeaQ/YmgE family stress response membrane protein [Eisenbergiella]MCI6708907.1 GlsB/YeaQ/YmgE family stress response membrane protein [Eisenbergiella massiliensis]MDY5528379.1 GlsB/YeaQ/YmgE family stress response membrane protein [Eisenbergiella porci]
MKTTGGTLRNIITGIVGGMIGSFLFSLIGFYAHGFLANLIVSVVGACIFIYIGKKLFGGMK